MSIPGGVGSQSKGREEGVLFSRKKREASVQQGNEGGEGDLGNRGQRYQGTVCWVMLKS